MLQFRMVSAAKTCPQGFSHRFLSGFAMFMCKNAQCDVGDIYMNFHTIQFFVEKLRSFPITDESCGSWCVILI